MALGIPLVPFYDADEDFDFEDQKIYYDDEPEDPQLREFRARKEEDDQDFQDSLDFEAHHRLMNFQDHFYKGWAEEYYSGKYKFWEDQQEERESQQEWVELPTLFFESGSLFIFGKIDNEMASNIIGSIVLLNKEKEDLDELTFFINSPGGFLKSGLAIFDMMQSCDLDLGLHTVGLGLVASTASLILCAGDQNERVAFPHTRVMIHQPTGEFRLKSEEKKNKEQEKEKKKEKKIPTLPISNRMDELTSYVDELLDLRQRVIDIYAFTTQQDADVISKDIERDFFMSAADAQSYGLIDDVIPHRKIESDEGKIESDEESVYKTLF
uniref:Clp protease proteolytic subunit n=1 Tax=Hypericum perforatum TaxID=65561 RepID=UPI0028FCEE7C|nr:Clp protease proteolytic subunit [Hypericum perforatum]WNE39653.1 Clp protease proteolytic subunit [Hypericum perforatum]